MSVTLCGRVAKPRLHNAIPPSAERYMLTPIIHYTAADCISLHGLCRASFRDGKSFRFIMLRSGMANRSVKDCRVGRMRPPRNDKSDRFCWKTEQFSERNVWKMMTKRSKNDAEQHRHSIHLEALYYAATRKFIRSHVVLLCSAIFSRTPRSVGDNPKEPLNQSAAALSGSFVPAYRFEIKDSCDFQTSIWNKIPR